MTAETHITTLPPAVKPDIEATKGYLDLLGNGNLEFTFQLIYERGKDTNSDFGAERDKRPPITLNGSLNDHWQTITRRNLQGYGVFVTVNRTNLKGRKKGNVTAVRALFVDADSADQTRAVLAALKGTTAKPTMAVKSSANKTHFYWCINDVLLGEFSALQSALAAKFGTDPSVTDLPRVMRLPGTLHQKSAGNPQLVQLKKVTSQRWSKSGLIEALGLHELLAKPRTPPQTVRDYSKSNMLPPSFAARLDMSRYDVEDCSALVAGIGGHWLDDKSDAVKSEVVRHGALYLAQHSTVFELTANGGNRQDYVQVALSIARSGVSDAEDIFVEAAGKAKNADDEQALRHWFQSLMRSPPHGSSVTVASLLYQAQKYGANFDRWKFADAIAACSQAAPVQSTASTAMVPTTRPELVGGTFVQEVALQLGNSHFLFNIGGDQAYCPWQIFDDGSVRPLTEKQFSARTGNIFVRVQRGDTQALVPFAKWWIAQPLRREQKIIMKPGGGASSDEYNLYGGFTATPDASRRLIRPLLRHIRNNICRGDKAKFKYVLRWLAFAVQHPDKPATTALILHSREYGTGKSILLKIMCHLFGKHGKVTKEVSDLTGKFNAHTIGWTFLCIDELPAVGTEIDRQLKAAITADERRIEIKGGDIFSIPNWFHIMATSNEEVPVRVGDGDRRYMVLEVGAGNVQDTEFFAEVMDCMEAGGYGQFLDFLLKVNLSGWHMQKMPATEERAAQMDLGADDLTQWLMCCIEDGAITGGGIGASVPLGTPTSAKALREAFYSFCRQRGVTKTPSPRQVGDRLTAVLGPAKPCRDGKEVVKKYDMPSGDALQVALNNWRRGGVKRS